MSWDRTANSYYFNKLKHSTATVLLPTNQAFHNSNTNSNWVSGVMCSRCQEGFYGGGGGAPCYPPRWHLPRSFPYLLSWSGRNVGDSPSWLHHASFPLRTGQATSWLSPPSLGSFLAESASFSASSWGQVSSLTSPSLGFCSLECSFLTDRAKKNSHDASGKGHGIFQDGLPCCFFSLGFWYTAIYL